MSTKNKIKKEVTPTRVISSRIWYYLCPCYFNN